MVNINSNMFKPYVAIVGGTLLLMSCGFTTTGNGYCVNPAPMQGTYDAALPGYIVVFNDGVIAATEVNRLNALYDLRVGAIYQSDFSGFFVEMSNITVEQLRCEQSIKYIQYNASVTTVSR